MRGHALADPLGKRHTFMHENDFEQEIDANQLVITAASTGTGVVGAGSGGILPLTTAATNNDDVTVEAPNEWAGFEAGKPWHACFLFNFTEINTDDANIAVGLANGVASGMLVNDGGGFITTCTSCAVVYKVDGSNVWKCTAGGSAAAQVANAKTSTLNASPGVASVAVPYQWVEIIWTPISTTQGYVRFMVDGIPLRDANVVGNPIIDLLVTITGSTTMAMFASVKSGAAQVEVLNLDFWGFYMARNRALIT